MVASSLLCAFGNRLALEILMGVLVFLPLLARQVLCLDCSEQEEVVLVPRGSQIQELHRCLNPATHLNHLRRRPMIMT